MGLIWTLIIGAIIGAIAGWLTSKMTDNSAALGWIGNIVAGLVGSWLGEKLLGTWGPSLAGMSLIPSIIGAIVIVLIVSVIIRYLSK